MKKFMGKLSLSILVLTVGAFAQIPCFPTGPVTSGLGMSIPSYGTAGWNTNLVDNFNCLDNYLSGVTALPASATQSPGDNTNKIATTAFVAAAVAGGGSGYSPVFYAEMYGVTGTNDQTLINAALTAACSRSSDRRPLVSCTSRELRG